MPSQSEHRRGYARVAAPSPKWRVPRQTLCRRASRPRRVPFAFILPSAVAFVPAALSTGLLATICTSGGTRASMTDALRTRYCDANGRGRREQFCAAGRPAPHTMNLLTYLPEATRIASDCQHPGGLRLLAPRHQPASDNVAACLRLSRVPAVTSSLADVALAGCIRHWCVTRRCLELDASRRRPSKTLFRHQYGARNAHFS